ncbi:hypothetical protein CYLTODRAFT_458158 [Cylindrobasidium torrendii FP15055 ss-10]|uniref:START domain-containing protein n=1 Tax=Cylindrobasidium torrendii FP15055 ss-10 TaxID=1314674 RepID=A0A0D7AYD9_9AGAR|nr:hypothetical protein CYLTODRAFT_458158 [Cylindrobasidium torrendii FP15055 ss-10]
MSDGSSLKTSWYDALTQAESQFQTLLTSTPAAEWKRISTTADSPTTRKGRARSWTAPEITDVLVHRRSAQAGEDIYRLTLELPAGEDAVTLEPWETVFSAPELRKEWDPAVVDAHLVEMLDPTTRVCKTNFTLGWPANPRDAVTISRSFRDKSTFIDVCTSLPRSPEEPVYLRPSPPYVRSNVSLFAWCVHHIPPSTDPTKRKGASRLRITCFWQHDLRSVWSMGTSSGIVQQLSTMVVGLFKTVLKRGSRVPKLVGYGNGVTIERVRFQIEREALTVDYAIIPEDDEHRPPSHPVYAQSTDDQATLQEHQRLTRMVECVLPAAAGWDVQLSVKGSSQQVEKVPWHARASKRSSFPAGVPFDQTLLRFSHEPLPDEHAILKVSLVIELSAPSMGLRLNGIAHAIAEAETSSPALQNGPVLSDMASSQSVQTSASSVRTTPSVASSISNNIAPARLHTGRTPAIEKSILSRVKRNYIYFSSLLQEPEAKWKRTTEGRGVTVTQLDSIDPTLVVYRAEATFVGVGLWDLYGVIATPGARDYWDKQYDDAILLEDVNDLTELWHLKTKPAWPVNGRDAVVLKTVYKSPSTIHVFAFSADDPHLFPLLPPSDINVIRTQIDLQGWAIEALSPTTTQVSLLEQSDPKGWTNKTSIPNQMISALAGIGEFTIKCGGPPVMTRLHGAKANEIRYDHERMNFRLEYEVSSTRVTSACAGEDSASNSQEAASQPTVECELRCDTDTWAPSLDIVIDPPPQSISALKRHRYSDEGGGLWLTIIHDAVFVDDERLLVIIRRGPGKEKGLVMVNGAKVNVDTEDIPESEIKSLAKRKRVKPARIPLDQPPVVGAIRRRKAEWDTSTDEGRGKNNGAGDSSAPSPTLSAASGSSWASAPRISSPLSRFFAFGGDSAAPQSAIIPVELTPSSTKTPMQHVLDGLAWVQEAHLNLASDADSWVLAGDKGLEVHRKLCPEISPTVHVHKSDKVIEGVSAEELAGLIVNHDCRQTWDDKFGGAEVFEAFGANSKTMFSVQRAQFPFRDRGFYVAGMLAKTHVGPVLSRRSTGATLSGDQAGGARSASYYVEVSFSPDSVSDFQVSKYNPYTLPLGRVYVDAWMLETLDPYSEENYAVPSSRCVRFVAVDYAGSLPTAMNSLFNTTLARSSLLLEKFAKTVSPIPMTRLPPAGVALDGRKEDHLLLNIHWKLRRRDNMRTLVQTRYSPDSTTYSATILVSKRSALSEKESRSQSLEQPTSKGSRIIKTLEGLPTSSSDLRALSPVGGLPSSVSENSAFAPAPTPLAPSVQASALSPGSSSQIIMRGRAASSSAFTIRGEPPQPVDTLVAELVIDTKLYGDGYTIHLKTRPRNKSPVIDLDPETQSTAASLPFDYTIYTIPLTPFYSGGMNAGDPTRQLFRLTLPTAQFEVAALKDPLTGEMRTAPPKPQWMLDLEDGGHVVDIEVRPGTGTSVQIGDKNRPVKVVGEKESLTRLGRESLSDERSSDMNVLSRSTNEAEVMPAELTRPIGTLIRLLEPTSSLIAKPPEEEQPCADEESSEPTVVEAAAAEDPPSPSPPTPTGSGIFSFFQNYQSSLSRLSLAGPVTLPQLPGLKGIVSVAEEKPRLRITDGKTPTAPTRPSTPTSTMVAPGQRMYPLSSLILTALIAFLIGSLIRSLVTPADFIYVVRDLSEVEETSNFNGWRELKRLFEVKYVLGGWDFQIAVVRRH